MSGVHAQWTYTQSREISHQEDNFVLEVKCRGKSHLHALFCRGRIASALLMFRHFSGGHLHYQIFLEMAFFPIFSLSCLLWYWEWALLVTRSPLCLMNVLCLQTQWHSGILLLHNSLLRTVKPNPSRRFPSCSHVSPDWRSPQTSLESWTAATATLKYLKP